MISPYPADSPPRTDWQPLRLLSFYRVILAGVLLTLYLALKENNPFGVELPPLFETTLLGYLAFGIIAGFTTRLHWPGHQLQTLAQVLADIAAITLLMHATGGVTSALSILLVIAVIAGALTLPGKTAYLFAAVATLALLLETGLATLSLEQTGAGNITRAGLLGMVLFAAAALANVLAVRLRETEALAQQRGVDLADLEQLNRYIIQQLQSGVLVVDAEERIRLANDTACLLLGMEKKAGLRLAEAAPEVARQLHRWQTDTSLHPDSIPADDAGGRTLIPSFSQLKSSQGHGALILLQDSARLAQQTQQFKLASLGRLTASIAHEIRNPLGAISHAAQLLQESEQLNKGDQRLTEIIGHHTRRVNTIIENVLQLSRRSASQPQNVPMYEWLQKFHDEFVHTEGIPPQALKMDIVPENLLLRVDPGHLHQVLSNLCQNAFSHTGKECEVGVQARRENNGTIRIDVVDNGQGIDPMTAEQMFEPFFTTASSGTGLGLYIARELCEINQASLDYVNTDAGGSCFRMRFTALQPAGHTDSPVTERAAS